MPGIDFSFTPSPDWRRLNTVLRRQGEPDRIPMFELYADPPIMEAVVGRKFPTESGSAALRESTAIIVEFHLKAGYDYVHAWHQFPCRQAPWVRSDDSGRQFLNAQVSTIRDRADFERYEWPTLTDSMFAEFEAVSRILPDGMKLRGGALGVLEGVMRLMSFEDMCAALADDPALVDDMFERVGAVVTEGFRRIGEFANTDFICLCEDMGSKTGTFFSPDFLRRKVFSWDRRIVDALHALGKTVILHACGNLSAVMEDIIATGVDALHSFQDTAVPVVESRRRWGSRITHCGGFDIDKLCRMTPDEVRAHTRWLVAECAPGGGWCLGSGNSVASYVPIANYVAMLEEGRSIGTYPIERRPHGAQRERRSGSRRPD